MNFRKVILWYFFLLFLLFQISCSQTENKIEFPEWEKEIVREDFEKVSRLGDLKNWEIISSPVNIEIDNKVSYSGNKSLKISFNFPFDFNFYHIMLFAKVLRETEYTLAGYVKTDIESGSIGFEVVDRRGYEIFYRATRQIEGVNDWTPLTINFTTPNDTEEIIIRVRHYGTDKQEKTFKGVVWIDNIQLVKGKLQVQSVEKPKVSQVEISIDDKDTVRKDLLNMLGIDFDVETIAPVLLKEETTEINKDYLDLFKEYPYYLVKWGGIPVNYFKWKWSIGLLEERKVQQIADRKFTKLNLGIVEFIKAVVLINPDTKFIWVLNMMSDTPKESAELVEFLIGDENTFWGEKRIEFGIKKPVNISMYDLGCELDFHVELDDYIKRCREIIKEIRKIQPEAKFLVQAGTAPHDPAFDKRRKSKTWRDWHRTVIKELKDDINYVTFHGYYYGLPPSMLEGYLDIISRDIKEITGEEKIKISFGEHGVWPHWEDTNKDWREYWYKTHSLQGCLRTAEWILRMVNRRDVEYVLYHNFSSGPWGLVYRDGRTGRLYTTGIFDLFKVLDDAFREGKEVMKTYVKGPYTNKMSSECSFICSVIKTDTGMNILLVNNEEHMSREISFKFPENRRYVLKEEVMLTGESINSYNKIDRKEIFVKKEEYKNDEIFNKYLLNPAQFVVLKLKEVVY
ncbi:MAG: hypothetical protein NC905_06715 [Candidatus Omnitrophica bacterium]|nr:hypothetical protein [Candidatus Omnitrophota bacterium]